MESKERILKMLEDGKISSEEAIELMSALNDKNSQNTEQSQQRTGQNDGEDTSSGGLFSDYVGQFVDEFNKYVNKDKVNDTYTNVKSKLGSQRQAKQVFDGLEKAFDSVGSSFDSVFSQGPKNRLIETVDEPFNSISVDISYFHIV